MEDAQAEREHEGKPQGVVDEWGDLSAMTDAAAAETMRRLDEEERASAIPGLFEDRLARRPT